MSGKIQPSHLERRAVVYLRQSDPRQVRNHPESTARQYALHQRAVALGWPVDRIEVIDEDLGQSATGTASRGGFKHLAEEVAHGHVGAILALEVSRLARSSADWYRLLDLCRLADVVLLDEQSVYTPRDSDDRLLLGLKGTMSEAEQTWLHLRLHGGRLNKARRGALRVAAGAGYIWDDAKHHLCFDPDQNIQHVIRLIFERFRLDGSAYAVLRYFEKHDLQMPGRDPVTLTPRWGAPRYSLVADVLRNPVYAGAYVWGRTEMRAILVDGQVRRSIRKRAQDAWTVCLRDQHPAYISWEEFMANQRKLRDNAPPRLPDQSGAPREGHALLQGIALCGRCGRKMTVHYCGPHARVYYDCRAPFRHGGGREVCWIVSGQVIDEAVVRLFLDTVQLPELEVALAVAHEAERQTAEVDKQWQLRLERVRYEARLAERRYKAVDPDNRVVARTLEHDWNDKLKELEEAERGYQEARRRDKLELSEADRAKVLSLSKDLRQVWNAETTTHADRKRLLRVLVSQVTLTPVVAAPPLTRIQVLWRTGAVSDFTIPRPRVPSLDPTGNGEVLTLIRSLSSQHKTSKEIAAELNRRGLRNYRGRPWQPRTVAAVRCREGLRTTPGPWEQHLPDQRADGLYSMRGVAARLGVSRLTVEYWVQQGWLVPVERSGRGRARWCNLDAATVARLETIKADKRKAPRQHTDGRYSVRGVAERLDVSVDTVRAWIAQGRLKPHRRCGRGHPSWFKLDPKTIARLQRLKLEHERVPCRHMPPEQRADGLYSVRGVAERLDVPERTVRYWIAQGWLGPRRAAGRGRTRWFKLGPARLARLQALKLKHTRSGPHAS